MNVCVFCGSGKGDNPVYANAARELGELIARQGHCLIYGGGNIGLMGVLADAVLNNSGNAIGVIPDFLIKKEVGPIGLTRLEVVSSMHERKRKMADMADVFLVLPGGWGTLDETAEILTWKQLGLINQPVGILNVNGFFDSFIGLMNYMVTEGFLKRENLDFIRIEETPAKILRQLIR
jgi:hypothetical protein